MKQMTQASLFCDAPLFVIHFYSEELSERSDS